MSETLTVRTTTRADLPRIDALFARSYPALLKADYPPSTLVTAIPLIARAQPRLVESGTYFAVMAENGEIVGAGGWTRGAPDGAQPERIVGHIRHVVTDHRRVRQGIGTALMRHVLADAAAKGVRLLACQSTRTAVPFYSSLGFETVRPIVVPLRPGIDFPAVLMRRFLDT